MSRRHISIVTRAQAAELFRAGLTSREVGTVLGVNHSTVLRWSWGRLKAPKANAPAIAVADLPAALGPQPVVTALTPEQQKCSHSRWQSGKDGYRCLVCDAPLPRAPAAAAPAVVPEAAPIDMPPPTEWWQTHATGWRDEPLDIPQPSWRLDTGK